MGCIIGENTFSFEIDRDLTGTLYISNELLNTKESAEECATSAFLDNSFCIIQMTLKTYLTDISLNDIINIAGLPYFVSNITTSGDEKQIFTSIGVTRYE